ncbi:MAG: hypothetical protein K2X86_09200 [Cytophagaceae bacterium]|nr:hypothetical protein [Cytophagaceae bacterium]
MAKLFFELFTFAFISNADAEKKLTNVKGADKYASILKAYYEKRLKQVKEQLENTKNKYLKQLENKNKEVEKVADEYRKVLWKREKYRMETYGFEWSDNGWINVDKGILPKDWETNTLEYLVKDGKSFDQLYTYVVYTNIQSIYRLNTSDNENFYVGNEAEKSMIIPKRKPALALAIGYKGEKPFIALESFETITTKKVSLTLRETTLADIKRILKVVNNGYRKENQIDTDLKYQEYFYKEKKRQEQLREEEHFMEKLRDKAFPCKKKAIKNESVEK